MLRFLKRLLGIEREDIEDKPQSRRRRPLEDEYSFTSAERDPTTSRYFTLLNELQAGKRQRDWERAAEAARATIDLLPSFVDGYGYELPPSIPVFTDGARALAMVGDQEALEALRDVTDRVPELDGWRAETSRALEDLRHLQAIRALASERPGLLQTEVKGAIGADDGRRVAVLLRQLEESGEIQRLQYKRTYLIGAAGEDLPLPQDHPAYAARSAAGEEGGADAGLAPTFDQNHERRRELKPRDLSLDDLVYVPLPRAPLRWEEKHKERAEPARSEGHFELGTDTDWVIESVKKLPMADRPDPAFRHLAPHGAGTFVIDDLGRAEKYPRAPAALLSMTTDGELRAEVGLAWGLYRWQANPMGHGVIAMDGEGVVHAYDADLRRLLATPLAQAPEMPGLMAQYHFDSHNLKNHTRSVALAPGSEAYLFTVVDSAFAVGVDGSPLWAARLPKQEGWTRVAEVSAHAGTSAEIQEALRQLELELPVTVEDVRLQYRRLAKRWHPDVNQGSAESEERFKEIGRAAEVLSGLNPASLAPDVGGAVYQKLQDEQTWEVEGMRMTVQFGMQASDKQASDWIYAATFAADGGAFLAGYSGRIVRVDPDGRPVRAYDVGAVPRRIGDTGDYLYFLTDTRLYILRDRALVRVLDVFEEGELVLGQTGFGLLEKKRFRWFSETGELQGEVLSNNPIRRIHSTPDQLIVQTRQRRATVTGAPWWWE